jgi:tRNA(Ile)-lysidine synthase
VARLPAPVARLRVAVRAGLDDLAPGSLVLVACSGGPDSLALADTVAFCAPRAGLRAGLVTVDHGLQDGSAERAADVAAWARDAGLDPVDAVAVDVGTRGGPEAAARDARYAALDAAAERHGAATILLGHTRDDQAETVLLALARGAGPRGIAAMRPVRGRYRRPLLGIARADTHAACEERGLKPWADPHNTDPRFRRSALRQAMDVLTGTLGDGVVANLARTASLVAADNDHLDVLAAEALTGLGTGYDDNDDLRTGADRDAFPTGADYDDAESAWAAAGLEVAALAALATPIRRRVLRRWALALGAPGGDLDHRHLDALDALVTAWRGQGPTYLPGGIEVARQNGRLSSARTPTA